MSLFVAMLIIVAWCVFSSSPLQIPPLEKRGVSETQRILTSELDAELPRLPFAAWFEQVVGPRAGVIWQLSECGEQPDAQSDSAEGMRACAEVNAVLPDGRKVVVRIAVGRFKKGMTGTPVFYHGVIERQGKLYPVPRLRDLPGLLRTPGRLVNRPVVRLPEATVPEVKLVINDQRIDELPSWSGRWPPQPTQIAAVPPPPSPRVGSQPSTATSPADSQKGSEEAGLAATNGMVTLPGAVSWGEAITKVQPRYPAKARRVKASGPVEVQVTISEAGHVIEATATSGHPLLREAAVEAARQWVFKPTILKGAPVQTQIVLTFIFKAPQ